jgi:hypothetical protein
MPFWAIHRERQNLDFNEENAAKVIIYHLFGVNFVGITNYNIFAYKKFLRNFFQAVLLNRFGGNFPFEVVLLNGRWHEFML